MAPVQNYAATPTIGRGVLSAANSGRDGTGTVVNILTAATFGTRIDKITIKAASDTTTGMVRIFLFDGTSYSLYEEISIQATTVDPSTPSNKRVIPSMALDLPSGWSLRASTENAEILYVLAEGANY